MKNLKILFLFLLLNEFVFGLFSQAAFMSASGPVLKFSDQEALKYRKILKVGQVEVLEFFQPVSLAHYGTSKESLDYIELDKLDPSQGGYRKFIVKAKRTGYGELTFQSGEDLIKVEVIVQNDFSELEIKLNQLFGMPNSTEEEKIRVIPSTNVGDVDPESRNSPYIYLKGTVDSPKKAMLALVFAANAVNDSGIKIFSNPGGQLRFKDLDSSLEKPTEKERETFIEYYESTNQLIDTNNLYRDLILASEKEKVISFIQIKEPKRFAVKVRFLEMDSRYIDEFMSSTILTSTNTDVKGAVGSPRLAFPTVNNSSVQSSSRLLGLFGAGGIGALGSDVLGGNLVSGAVKLLDDTFLNVDINSLLEEGVLRVVNEFSLITHSGERLSLGKGLRFPVPKINNNVGGSTVSVEYIPIGFKGELKVTALESEMIDVQLASRLSSAESASSSINGFVIPIFKEEFVNSGALLNDGQEVVLNSFLTETESIAKATSPLGRVIPFLGKSKQKKRTKNLLFIAIKAEEVLSKKPESLAESVDFHLPHLDLKKNRNIFADNIRELRSRNLKDTLEIQDYQAALQSKKDLEASDPAGFLELRSSPNLPGIRNIELEAF
jgi:Flp pilus assembly secretin CpaC